MGYHRRYDRSHILRAVGIIFFDQIVHTRTACRNNIRHLIFPHKFFIFICHKSRPFRSLSHLIKSKFQKRVHDLPRLIKIKNSRIGRSDRYDRFKPLCQISFHSFQIACKCFCVLRTDFQTAPAVDTMIDHNARLLVFDTDRFYRAVSYAFITMTAFCIFKINDFHSSYLL